MFPTLSDLYAKFLITTFGVNKSFATMFWIFVVYSFTSYHEADKSGDRLNSLLDDHFQPTSFDFIVVGAGTAGSIVASRLSMDGNFKVLLLEAGGEVNPFQLIPALGLGAFNQPNVDWSYKSVPQQHSCLAMKDNATLCSSGKGLGGSSNLNLMTYTRGSPKDFDNWANHTRDPRWSYANVTEMFKKVEFWDDSSYFATTEYHGKDGKLRVAYPPHSGIGDQFVEAGAELGYPKLSDINLPYTTGFGKVPLNVAVNGERLSPFQAFIQPTRYNNRNLVIYKFALVEKILIDDNHVACGVRYTRHGKTYEAAARREVILSAGAIGSPQILMLSGIGPRAHLESLNIPVQVDLPAVGQNYQDHTSVIFGPFTINKSLSFVAERDVTPMSAAHFLTLGEGKLTNAHVLGAAYFVSSAAKKRGEQDWPDLQFLLGGLSISDEESTKMFEYALGFQEGILKEYFKPAAGKDSFFIGVNLARPRSRGQILLASKDGEEFPLIDPSYYSHPDDMPTIIEGLKEALRLTENTTAFRELDTQLVPGSFPGCEGTPYRSDEYLECLARSATSTFYDRVGTCSMGVPESRQSVVDSQLRVIGVQGLRVIDASVMPFLPGTNTQASTVMIGQMGSELIMGDHEGEQGTTDITGNLPIDLPARLANNPMVPSIPRI